jgi:DNA topoisomerase-3
MKTVVLYEKPDAARKGEEAGFPGLAARGHLFENAPPEDYGETWQNYHFHAIRPAVFKHPPKGDADAKQRLRRIGEALAGADTVAIATDDDREGERIAWDILDHLRFKGRVRRVIFSALDKASLKKAFANLQPAEKYKARAHASAARDKADWVWGMSLSRAVTKALVPPGVRFAIPVGRVKTPTLGIVGRREEEILAFKAQDFFRIVARCDTAGGALILRHSPEEKIVDRSLAERIAAEARDFSGPLRVKAETRRTRPPLFHSMDTLLAALGRRGWAVEEVAKVAQTLYERGVISYPGTDGQYLPASQEPDIPGLVGHLLKLPAFGALRDYRYATTGCAAFNDAKVAQSSHHALVPNAGGLDENPGFWGAMNGRERELFLELARRYLEALGPDEIYESVAVSLDIRGRAFTAAGRTVKDPGWRAVLRGEKDDDEEEVPSLPPVADGQAATVTKAEVEADRTKPPPRLTEGALIQEMMAAHKYVTDPDKKKRLRGVEGLGRPRTRPPIVEELKESGQLVRKGKFIVPTEVGLAVYRILVGAGPVLAAVCDPGETALWEGRLDEVEKGRLDEAAFLNAIEAEVARIAGAVKDLKPLPEEVFAKLGAKVFGDGPSPAQLAFAERLAREQGLVLPADCRTDRGAMKSWLDAHAPKREGGDGPRAPSEKQLAFAEKLAKEKGKALPGDCRTDGKACSAFIDGMMGKKGGGRSASRGKGGPGGKPPGCRRR